MTVILCPVCHKRVCDSNKNPKIAPLSKSNENKADIVIKCNKCKNQLSIRIPKVKTSEQDSSPIREVRD